MCVLYRDLEICVVYFEYMRDQVAYYKFKSFLGI